MRFAFPKPLILTALSIGALSLPPLELLQRADRALFDAWSRIAGPAPPADIIVLELPNAKDQPALVEKARWQSARLVLTTLADAPIVPSGELPVLGPVAVGAAGAPILQDTGWSDGGYLWPQPDFDGVVRFEQPTLVGGRGPVSLPLVAAQYLERLDAPARKTSVDARGPLHPDAATTGRRWLRFFRPEALRPVSPADVGLSPEALTGKVVVLGRAGDTRHRTPLGPLSTAELVAHALAGYRQHTAVTTSFAWDTAGWVGAAAWTGLVGAVPAAGLAGTALTVTGALGLLTIGSLAFIVGGIWLPVAGPALLVLTLAGAAVARRRAGAPSPFADTPQSRADGRRLMARGDLAGAWSALRALPMSRELVEQTYELGCALADHGQQSLAADAFHRVAQADAEYKDVARRLVDASADPHRPPLAQPQPDALGRYEILGVVGSGAMGVVYLGRDPSLKRIVAIKAINLEQEFDPSDLDEVRGRFTREAEIAGRLNHPAIVTIYDVGEQDGIAYIAMEYVRGTHLSEHASPDTLLPVDEVLELIARAAEALDHAHRYNVVHRDIKPANIMYDSVTDSLKITDFGVARLMDVSRTRTGVILGTPSYMSPEQLQGENVNGHTDLFALGVTLYQLLTGHLPFRGNSMTELMFVIANEPHIPVTDVRSELPPVLDSLLGRALAKDPSDRFSDGAAMAHALRAAFAGH